MTVSVLGVNAAAGQSAGVTTPAGTASITPTLPVRGTVANPTRVFVFQGHSGVSAATPSGWTVLGTKDAVVGSGAVAAGGGQRFMTVYYRDDDGTWTIPAFDLTSVAQNSHSIALIVLGKDPTEAWATPTISGIGNYFPGTAATAFSAATPAAFTTVVKALVMAFSVTNDNVTATAGALTGTNGFVSGTVTERVDGGTATGNDVSVKLHTASPTTAASPAGTLTHTQTLSAASQGGWAAVQQTVTYGGSTPTGAFLYDLMRDVDGTNLTAHTPEAGGGAWSVQGGSAGGALITANRCYPSASTVMVNSSAPASADYDVTADFVDLTDIAGYWAGVVGRASATATTMYGLALDQAGSTYTLQMSRWINGAFITLANVALPSQPAAGSTHKLTLRMQGSQISGYYDDVLLISPVTDTGITAAGLAGLHLSGTATPTTGIHCERITGAALPKQGTASGTYTWAGTDSGKRVPKGTAGGNYTWGSTAIGMQTPPVGTFVYDSFTDTAGTNLSAHTPEMGGTWSKVTGNTLDTFINASGRLYRTGSGANSVYMASGVPPSADYSVTSKLRIASGDWYQLAGVAGRVSNSANTYYDTVLYLNGGSGWYLYLRKKIAGTQTDLVTGVFISAASGSWVDPAVDHTITLRMVGTTISAYVDGVKKLEVTDSSITAAGFAGVVGQDTAPGATLGLQADTVTAVTALTSGTAAGTYKWNGFASGTPRFVTRDPSTGNLLLKGKKFRFAGGNTGNDIGLVGSDNIVLVGGVDPYARVVHSGQYLATHSQIDALLTAAQGMNATVLRPFAGAAGSVNHVDAIQPTLGAFNPAGLESLDYALAQCALRGIKLVVPLSDEYSSKPWYVAQTTGGAASDFHTNATTIGKFKDHISFVLDHINPYTGIALKDDPTVLCWTTGNELSGAGTTGTQFADWNEDIASYIKVTKGAQQLVMDGGYGTTSDWVTFDTYRYSRPHVDIFNNHSYDNYRTPANMVAEANAAHAAGKAFILEEFTWTGVGFAPQPTWTLAQMLSAIETGKIDGDLFWDFMAQYTIWGDGFTLHYPPDATYNGVSLTEAQTRSAQLTTHAAYMAVVPKSGDAAGTYTWAGTATGKRVPKASGSGAYTWAGTATGQRVPKASGSGAYTWASTATGKRVPKASASGAYTWAATVTGQRVPKATASGAYTWAATATGKRVPKASTSGAYTWAGAATGDVPPNRGTTSGGYTWAGAAAGSAPNRGTASGAYTWAGTAVGDAPPDHGSASGAYTWAAAATGKRTPKATGSGAYTWAGSALGGRAPVGAASGTYTWVGTVTGKRVPKASASGAYTWVAVSTGARASRGSASGGYTWSATANGIAPQVGVSIGNGFGTYMFSGSVAGGRTSRGAAAADYGWAGAATGRYQASGAAGTGAYIFAGDAVGDAPVLAIPLGSSAGSYGWGSTIIGAFRAQGGAGGDYRFDGLAMGPVDLDSTSERLVTVDAEDRTVAVTAADRSTVVAAAERTVSVGAQDRTVVVEAVGTRTVSVAAESRVVAVGAEDRTVMVPAQDHDLAVTGIG